MHGAVPLQDLVRVSIRVRVRVRVRVGVRVRVRVRVWVTGGAGDEAPRLIEVEGVDDVAHLRAAPG